VVEALEHILVGVHMLEEEEVEHMQYPCNQQEGVEEEHNLVVEHIELALVVEVVVVVERIA